MSLKKCTFFLITKKCSNAKLQKFSTVKVICHPGAKHSIRVTHPVIHCVTVSCVSKAILLGWVILIFTK